MDGRAEVVVGSEVEQYLRVLQVAGDAPLQPWSLRGFAPAQVDGLLPDSAHLWTGRYRLRRSSGGGIHAEILRPGTRLTYNSAVPYGYNDGPVWAGRGVTAEARLGAALRYGALSLRLEPVVFWSENRAFPLMPNGATGRLVYADGRAPGSIDLPQRFGDGAYARVDPGESTVRLDVLGAAVGFSTASQHWGPASEFPILLGNNAGGFAHAFLGTSVPVRTPIGRVHGRVLWGSLAQSDYSSVEGNGSRRFGTGVVGVFTPRGLDGLELGAARFFHLPYPARGLRGSDLLYPFRGITKASLDSTDLGPDGRSSPDNQLASVFARWVFPRAGMEVYGEFGHEDHNWDLLDVALEPDHTSGYMLGFRKVWSGATRLVSLRGEVLNTQVSHLAQVRNQTAFYRHFAMRQGHTQRGQVLGAAYGYGGGGSVLGVDVYHPRGRWSVEWTRGRMGERANYLSTGEVQRDSVEVVHSLAAEALLFRGPFEVVAGVTGTANLNRNYASDVYNLNGQLGVRFGF